MLRVFVPKERAEGETRVAATPETVQQICAAKLTVTVERGAGSSSYFPDADYEEAGAEIVEDAAAAYRSADIVLKVAPPCEADGPAPRELKKGALFIGFLAPYKNQDLARQYAANGVTAVSMELVPRITRAQKMDALSSQASIGGYKAVLLGAANLPKYFPLLMTAAGTVKPARVVVMGAGVAGLQAIATAKRLGAVVEASDIRPAVKEQVESLGGRFIDLPEMEESGEGEGGYAKQVSKEFLQKQQEIVRARVLQADVVITTALVPGRPAPRLITADTVEAMKPGAVIVDMAVEQGGNCELSEKGRDVVKHDVLIIGNANLPATMPKDASMLYARNVLALLKHAVEDGKVHIDLDDEVNGCVVTHDGRVCHAPTGKALQQDAEEQPSSDAEPDVPADEDEED